MNSETKETRKGAFAAWGAMLVAVLSSACCWLPLLLLVFGISGGVVSAKFEALRPVLVPVTFALLALGWYFTLKPMRTSDGDACASPDDGGESCCPPERAGKFSVRKFNLGMLTFATVMSFAFAFFPNYLGAMVSVGSDANTATGQSVVLGIEGMTCTGCEVHVAKNLESIDGVVVIDVDYETKSAAVKVPLGTDESVLQKAIADAGYKMTSAKFETDTKPEAGTE